MMGETGDFLLTRAIINTNHICKVTPSMVLRTMELILELYFL
jgi:hypothetical protein